MSIAPWSITLLLLVSGIFAAVLIREYLRVTMKRRGLIAALGGSGRAVPFLKRTLMMTYIVTTILWSIGLLILFFSIH
jgi:hypothetical protein